jgi:hypothetical protein
MQQWRVASASMYVYVCTNGIAIADLKSDHSNRNRTITIISTLYLRGSASELLYAAIV